MVCHRYFHNVHSFLISKSQPVTNHSDRKDNRH
nr:MAG TPA: hypothetical protein [Caudoviricetes sp.]